MNVLALVKGETKEKAVIAQIAYIWIVVKVSDSRNEIIVNSFLVYSRTETRTSSNISFNK